MRAIRRARRETALGLALVAAIGDLHGLDCRASDNHPGLRVTIATAANDE